MTSSPSALVADAELSHTLGVVSDRPQPDPERQHTVETSVDVGTSVQRDGGCSVRTDDVPRRRHVVRSGRRERGRSRDGRDPVRTNVGADQGVQTLVRSGSRGISLARDRTLRVHGRPGRTDAKHLRADHRAQSNHRSVRFPSVDYTLIEYD